jgi:lipoyl(octanoyl) transferase
VSPDKPLLREPGRVDYADCWARMLEFTRTRGPGTVDEIWLVEHDPVFTLGVAGRQEHVLAAGEIPVIATDRGGQVTYHGPGQLVAYPLIDLRRAGLTVRALVERLEAAAIDTLAQWGVQGLRVTGAPGVYVARAGAVARDPRFMGLAKIAALGVKIHRGCSYHGLSLNVDMDLAPFARIDPCGYAGLDVTDLATLGARPGLAAVRGRLAAALQARLAQTPETATTSAAADASSVTATATATAIATPHFPGSPQDAG